MNDKNKILDYIKGIEEGTVKIFNSPITDANWYAYNIGMNYECRDIKELVKNNDFDKLSELIENEKARLEKDLKQVEAYAKTKMCSTGELEEWHGRIYVATRLYELMNEA